MTKKYNFEKQLTTDDIQFEIDKVGKFFEQIPDELKAEAAYRFIYEIVNWGCYDHYQALGIFEEAKQAYREVSLEVMEEELEDNRVHHAYENAVGYICIVGVDWLEDDISSGDIVKATYAGENANYAGNGMYDVFVEKTHTHCIMCKESFESHFELVGED